MIRDLEKLEQRRHVAFEAACGISTAELTRIAALPIQQRPAALAQAAQRYARTLECAAR
jgi:hypothetical protein